MSASEGLYENALVDKVFKYFEHKGKKLCLVVMDENSKEMDKRSTINSKIVGKFLMKESGEHDTLEEGWFTGNKAKFPRVPGRVREVLADTNRLNRYATPFLSSSPHLLLRPSSSPQQLLHISSSAPPHLLLLGTLLG